LTAPSPASYLSLSGSNLGAAMHVTLIRPPQITSNFAPHTLSGMPPIGLAFLGAALEQAGHTVRIIDSYGESPNQVTPIPGTNLRTVGLTADEIAARIPPETDVIGVSCMFSQEWLYAKRVIAAAHRAAPSAPIVTGGEHATADPGHVLRSSPEVVACVLGEGEETLLEVVDAVATGRDLRELPGLALRADDGAMLKTPRRERIRSIDDLPWPAWHLVPIEMYLDNHFGHEAHNQRSIPMLATRGCPYRCTFCSSPSMWGTRWLARDPEDVIREIKHYIERYRVDHVEFYDLTAIVDKRWTLRFTELLKRERLPITWRLPSGTRSEALDDEVLPALVESGCVALLYAPESGSPRTLARIKKKMKPERMIQSMRAAVKAGILVRGHFIMGMPGQTLSEIAETYLFIAKMAWVGVHDVNSYFFYPYPGSEMHRDLVAAGKIDPEAPDYDEFLAAACYTDLRAVRSFSEYFTPAHLRLFVLTSIAFFYALSFARRPQRIFASLGNIARGEPRTWFERVLHEGFKQWVLRRKLSRVATKRVPAATAPALATAGGPGATAGQHELRP
jgi:anaerobic magnesium-protoporphyrin IX monomethyl ester cyclase